MAAAPTTGLNLQPKYNFYPGYIIGPRTVSEKKDGIESEIKVLALTILKPNIWGSLNNREEIIDNKKIVYIKMLQNEVVEIGIHLLQCQNIQKLNLVRILLGPKLLPQNTKVTALHEVVYQKTVDKFLPDLTKGIPLANPRALQADSSPVVEKIKIGLSESDLIENSNTKHLPGLITSDKTVAIEEDGIKTTEKAFNIILLTDEVWGEFDEFGRKFIIDGKNVVNLKFNIIKEQGLLTKKGLLTVGIGLHFSKYDLINNLGYRILFLDNILPKSYPIASMDEKEYANVMSQILPSIPAAPLKLKSRSITFLGCLSAGHLEMKRNNEKEICIIVVLLSRKIWSQLNEVRKEELINGKKFVCIKYTDIPREIKNFSSKFIQKIEILAAGIEQIKEIKANSNVLINSSVGFVVRKEFGDDLPYMDEDTMFPENTPIVPLQDKIYDKRIKEFILKLSTPNILSASGIEADESLISMLSSDLEEEKED